MMNVMAFSWLLVSLVTAGVWSPAPNQKAEEKTPAKLAEDHKVLVREGHRVFMIEYEREGLVDAAKKGTRDTFHSAAELAKATGQGIRSAASEARDKAEVAGEQAVHVIKSGADSTKEAVKSTADKASHAVKDTASSLLHGSEKEVSRDEMVKEAEHKAGEIYGSAKQNETLKSVGEYIHEAGGSLKDAAQKLSDAGTEKTEKIRVLKDEGGEKCKEKVDFVKERSKDLYEAPKDTSRDAVHKVNEVGLKVKDTVKETYDAVKDRVSGGGQTVKESVKEPYDSVKDRVSGGGRAVKESVKESYDSTTGKVSDAGDKIKGAAEKTSDSAKDLSYRAKNSLGFDRVDYEDIRIQRALRHAGEAAIEKFRQTMEEVYRISTNGEALRRAGNVAERKIFPVLSQDAKDLEANVEGAAVRTSDLAATNVSAGSRLMVSRIERLTSRDSLMVGTRMLHLLAFSTIYGSSIWVNFLSGHVIANAVPRHQFGFIQSKMYPVYFKTVAYGLATCLLTHSALHSWKSDAKVQRWQDYNLLVCLALTLLNMIYLEPRATKLMFEKMRIEKEEGRGTDVVDLRGHSSNFSNEDDMKRKMVFVNRRLKRLHRISSAVNMLTLMGLTWHLGYLSSFIKS